MGVSSGGALSTEEETVEESDSKSLPNNCTDLNSQTILDIEQITGMWFGEELLQHHYELKPTKAKYPCIVIHISQQLTTVAPSKNRKYLHNSNEVEDYAESDEDSKRGEHSYEYLLLLWDEDSISSEYSLLYNRSRPGLWISTNSAGQDYYQVVPINRITATIQVMKAVGSHMVLTFCETNGQLYSIVLSRKPHMLTADEVRSVESLLNWRGLRVDSSRKLCTNYGISSKGLSHQSTTIIAVVIALRLVALF